MHIRCPHCHNPIEVVDTDPLIDISCPSCGSNFNLISGETATYTPGAVKNDWAFRASGKRWRRAFRHGVEGPRHEARPHRGGQDPAPGQLEGPEAEMFLREARAAAQVKHPGVVGVHEVGREDDTLYIVSDFIDGCNLKELAFRPGSLRPGRRPNSA